MMNKERRINLMINKKGQVAIFIIIALVIVAGITVFFLVRGTVKPAAVSVEFRPIYDTFDSCIKEETLAAANIVGSQGGFIDVPDYIPGSEYAPTSSQLNFMGIPVPYWFYISGNGLLKENVPTKTQIEGEMSDYIAGRINNCNFQPFYGQGFAINLSSADVKTTISQTSISVTVNERVVASRENNVAAKNLHNVAVDSKLGTLYDLALKIYDKEKSEAFLENYSVDVLRLYAPVDGMEVSCSGRIWKTQDVVNDLKNALEANVAAIRFKGGYYSASSNPSKKYFVVDVPVSESVNLIYSRNWPSKIEIAGANNELMAANPIGTQRGLGTMGFCYSEYHFVYDISYPVLVQVYSGREIFQFPVVVIVDKNLPRKGIYSEIRVENESFDFCQFNTQDLRVGVYDVGLNKINANLTYECFNQRCKLGETTNGEFVGKSPACVNGFLEASAEGYATKRELLSTSSENGADLIMDRERELGITVGVEGTQLSGTAVVIFERGDDTVAAAVPGTEKVKLAEGAYNVTVYVYGNTSITIPASTKRQCVDTLAGGIGGFLGITTEKCFDIVIPETKIESALIGGGKSGVYILNSDLDKKSVRINVNRFNTPKSIDELATNFEIFENTGVEVNFE